MITRISQIEITSRCSLHCQYCPQPKMERAKADMPDDVFDRTLYWLREFVADGTQRDVNLHHFGESTLHPKFVEMVDRISDIVPLVQFSTNGVGVTKQMIFDLKDAGLSRIALSVHRPEVVMKVEDFCLEAGLPYDWASGMVSSKHNWAGQVEGRNSAWAETYPCQFLIDQACVVLQDGRVANCCIDAEGISASISVFDDLRALELKPFSLCVDCHHQIPEDRFPRWREKLEEVALVH